MFKMTETTRQHYPNLYYVQIGNHPYSKEGRLHKSWLLENAQKNVTNNLSPPRAKTVLYFAKGFALVDT